MMVMRAWNALTDERGCLSLYSESTGADKPRAAVADQFRDGAAASIVAVCCAVGAGVVATIAGSVR
ncbi:hypothetical protein ABIE91_002393 [Bradyrhizobium elkanii]